MTNRDYFFCQWLHKTSRAQGIKVNLSSSSRFFCRCFCPMRYLGTCRSKFHHINNVLVFHLRELETSKMCDSTIQYLLDVSPICFEISHRITPWVWILNPTEVYPQEKHVLTYVNKPGFQGIFRSHSAIDYLCTLEQMWMCLLRIYVYILQRL